MKPESYHEDFMTPKCYPHSWPSRGGGISSHRLISITKDSNTKPRCFHAVSSNKQLNNQSSCQWFGTAALMYRQCKTVCDTMPLSKPMQTFYYLGSWEQTSLIIESNLISNDIKKMNSKHRQQNDGHFDSAFMCWSDRILCRNMYHILATGCMQY